MAQYPSDINHRLTEKPPVGWPWQLFLITLAIFLVSALVYLGLASGYRPFLEKEIRQIKSEISDLSLEVSSEQRRNFTNFYSQLVNLTKILQNHTAVSGSLIFLEENILPEVAISSLEAEISEKALVLDAAAESYDNLIEQMVIFEESPLIERASLESSQLSGNLIRFRVKLILKPQIFSLQ